MCFVSWLLICQFSYTCLCYNIRRLFYVLFKKYFFIIWRRCYSVDNVMWLNRMTTRVIPLWCVDVRVNSALSYWNNVHFEGDKIAFKSVIWRLVSQVSYEMTTSVRSSICVFFACCSSRQPDINARESKPTVSRNFGNTQSVNFYFVMFMLIYCLDIKWYRKILFPIVHTFNIHPIVHTFNIYPADTQCQHMVVSKWHRCNLDATSERRIEVATTSCWRCVPGGQIVA